MAKRTYKRLSEQDHQFIKDNYHNMTNAAIAKVLGCSAGYVSRQCSILKYAKRKQCVKPAAASLRKAPPATESHLIEPAPEIIPGLIIKGLKPKDNDWESIKLYVDERKRMVGTYREPICEVPT